MNKEVDEKAHYVAMAALCARREYAQSDIRERLLKRGCEREVAEHIVERLVQESFLSEQRYAKAYANDKMHYNGWGKQKIHYMLKAKQVDEEWIEEAIAQLDESVYRKNLKTAWESKKRTLKANNEYEAKQKLIQYVMRKGYSYDEVQAMRLDDTQDAFDF